MSILRQFIQETESMANAELATNVVSFRDAKAKRIKELATAWAENTIQLGRELNEARDSFPEEKVGGAVKRRPDWENWLKTNIGFSIDYANRLIRIWQTFGGKTAGLAAPASFKVLDYLSTGHVPDEAREQVIKRISAGETIGKGKAQNIVEAVKTDAPPPSEANRIAKETGKPTLARDGNYYLGASKEEAAQTEARRRMVYGVRDAVKALAETEVTPAQFLKQALPHQLWSHDEEHLIGEALDWLTRLAAAWEKR